MSLEWVIGRNAPEADKASLLFCETGLALFKTTSQKVAQNAATENGISFVWERVKYNQFPEETEKMGVN